MMVLRPAVILKVVDRGTLTDCGAARRSAASRLEEIEKLRLLLVLGRSKIDPRLMRQA
jgi:hypothetical protein